MWFAYSLDFVDTTGKLADLLVGSFPEATSRVTAYHIYALIFLREPQAQCISNLVLLNALNALLKLATPTEYLTSQGIGSRCSGYYLIFPLLSEGFSLNSAGNPELHSSQSESSYCSRSKEPQKHCSCTTASQKYSYCSGSHSFESGSHSFETGSIIKHGNM